MSVASVFDVACELGAAIPACDMLIELLHLWILSRWCSSDDDTIDLHHHANPVEGQKRWILICCDQGDLYTILSPTSSSYQRAHGERERFTPYTRAFFDHHAGPLPDVTVPSLERHYQVTFDVAGRTYVVYYAPAQNGERGLIYLPGPGEPWQTTNIIISNDGHWFPASAKWDALMQQFLFNVEGRAARPELPNAGSDDPQGWVIPLTAPVLILGGLMLRYRGRWGA